MSQGYAAADLTVLPGAPPSQLSTELGLVDEGTFAYRSLALQFRYRVSDDGSLVVQLAHERNGESVVDGFRDEVELDWAFYQHNVADRFRLRVGRFPLSFGAFNEIRDVGTLLPLYRPSAAVYGENTFTSETIDGLSWAYRDEFAGGSALEVDAYAGQYDAFESSPLAPTVLEPVEARDIFGFQLWVDPPVDGLRIGAHVQTLKQSGGLVGLARALGEESTLDDYLASIVYEGEAWFARAEHRWLRPSDLQPGFGGDFDAELSSWYAHIGRRFGELGTLLVLQLEGNHYEVSLSAFNEFVEFDPILDLGLALRYAIRPEVMLKVELHRYREEQVTSRLSASSAGVGGSVSSATGELSNAVAAATNRLLQVVELDEGTYGILAVSVSF
ncbi:MAG: hypothetical protein AAGC60_23015 [Acidobacteriota bacterium]